MSPPKSTETLRWERFWRSVAKAILAFVTTSSVALASWALHSVIQIRENDAVQDQAITGVEKEIKGTNERLDLIIRLLIQDQDRGPQKVPPKGK